MWKNLKSLFIVEEEGGQTSKSTDAKPTGAIAKPKSNAPKADSNPTTPRTGSTPKPVSAEGGKVRPKFMEILLKAMDANDLDGYDYLEYKRSLKSLEKMPMDEATRYKSAYAMAETLGASKQHLLDSGKQYLDVLGAERQKFQAASEKQRKQRVGDKMAIVEQMQSLIKEKSAQITRLTQEIDKHRKQMEQTQGKIKTDTAKIEQTKRDFEASFQQLTDQILKDLDNIQSHV